MDAERLIGVSRHALAGSTGELDVIAEAWQAQALAQAIGIQLALNGPKELKSEARELGEAGGLDCGLPDLPGLRIGRIRAGRLSGVADVRAALTGLGALLGEVGIALVAVACATDEEGLYWQCIDAIDAADESNDRVAGMLRRLMARDREREREWARQREERELGLEWQRERERESRIGRDGRSDGCPKVQDGGHGSSNLHRAPARGELRDTADRGQGHRGPGL